MLQFSGIKFKYDQGPVFNFPDFSCHRGDQILLLGESGKGKTTLLHLLAGLLTPTEGKVILAGKNLIDMSPEKKDIYRGKHIGIVFQSPHFIRSLNVIDNLILPQFFTGRKIDRNKGQEILQRLNLGDKAHKRTQDLSVGEQQRVAIARALINNPDLILADEPTSALDDKNAHEVIGLLEKQASISNAALVIVTHDQRLKDKFSNRVEL